MVNTAAPQWIPGPWRAQRMASGDWFIRPVANRGEPVVGNGWDEANSRLMAAAPELYDALRDAVYEIAHLAPGPTESGYSCIIQREVVDRFRAILAKARGE